MSNTDNVQEISVGSITRDPNFQARNQLDVKLVKQYAKAMENGAKFPPIQLAQIEQALIIVDGWHRHAAAHSLNHLTIDAVVSPMTRFEALRGAALVNSKHGKPLKAAERRNAFRLFIKGKGHKKANGGLLSYREIAEALGGAVGHTTIYGWMHKDFARIAKDMGAVTPRAKGGEPPPDNSEVERCKQIAQSFNDTLHLYKMLTCPNSRYEVVQQVEKGLAEMKTFELQDVGF